MHRIAKEIQNLLDRAHLTATDFFNVTEKLTNSLDDVEDRVIALLAPLSAKEKDLVMADLAETMEKSRV